MCEVEEPKGIGGKLKMLRELFIEGCSDLEEVEGIERCSDLEEVEGIQDCRSLLKIDVEDVPNCSWMRE